MKIGVRFLLGCFLACTLGGCGGGTGPAEIPQDKGAQVKKSDIEGMGGLKMPAKPPAKK